jgi:hypothetical protein
VVLAMPKMAEGVWFELAWQLPQGAVRVLVWSNQG